MSVHAFTVDEVNALVPELRKAAKGVVAGAKLLEKLAEELYEEQPESDTSVNPQYASAVMSLQSGVEAIQALGGEVKDLKQGLVDFRSVKNGREVCLCWLPSEGHVAFWHDLHAGFAGRTAITEDDDFGGAAPDDGDETDDEEFLARDAD